MSRISNLEGRINRLQILNSELFLMSHAIQNFINSKSTDEIVNQLLEFCSELTGAQEISYLSCKEKSKKRLTVTRENHEIKDAKAFMDSAEAKEKDGSSANGECFKVQLSTEPKRQLILCKPPMPEKIAEYSDIIAKVTAPFLLALKEKEYAEQRDTTVEFLNITNTNKGTNELVKAAVRFFQTKFGCDAVGIRLKEGEDYPYYEARGFSPEHLYYENKLCTTDSANCVIRDFKGDPVLECMCGNIICGRFSPEKEFFTAKGSFWTNSTTKLLAETTDADRQTHTRNRCNGEGYESVALLPLQIANNRLGLLQLNDRRKGMFNLELIKLWETLSDYLALALSRTIAEEKLQDYTKNLENLIQERSERLKIAERLAAIGATAGMVGHDIRNPLQAMTSDVYLIKDELDSAPECKSKLGILESIESIEQNIGYINKIVADLQDYSRVLKPEMTNIADLCSVVKEIVDSIIIPSNISVSLTCSVKRHCIKLELTYLKRILTNLVTNAIQAMPSGGGLTIASFERAGKLLITVEDTGAGIPEEVKPHLFKPLMTTKSKGQGLGLAVVKRLTEALNGDITFESQEGKGTKFVVELPL